MMDMHSRNQYLKVLQERYFITKSKKEKSKILNEYCKNTGQNRKYVIRKINSPTFSIPKKRKRKKEIYDGLVGIIFRSEDLKLYKRNFNRSYVNIILLKLFENM